jgi:hypothetical protein
VLPLGDVQYNSGTAAEFAGSYQPSWGRLKAITRPAVGNHEYGSPGAAPYFHYFGAAAGDPEKGYYSYELGSWHLIALNSNCAQIDGCSDGSRQVRWLLADLAAHPVTCTLAYWHHPRFSSGQNGDAASMDTIWRDLNAAGADVVLNGHDHDYERFGRMAPDGRHAVRGLREFVVGTGGISHYQVQTVRRNSVTHDDATFGVLLLTLHPTSYSWQFIPVAGGRFTDSGSGNCV